MQEEINRDCKIVYMGTPDFAVAPLKALLDKGYTISAVVTIPDKKSGRGQKLSQSPVKLFAIANNIKVLQPISLKDPQFTQELKQIEPHLMIVVAFRMLPKEVWSLPRLGTFNLHASLLPNYRGAAPINWAIINGEKRSGVSTFFIDQNIDTGQILFSEECEITPDMCAGDLHDILMNIGSDLVVKTTQAIIENSINPIPQSSINLEEELKIAPKIDKELCKIDWNNSSTSLHNLIRGLSPYPCAFSTIILDDKESLIKIYKSSLNNLDLNLSPGEIHTDKKNFFIVGCKDGAINIDSLQLAGKKRVSIKEFLAGINNISSIHLK